MSYKNTDNRLEDSFHATFGGMPQPQEDLTKLSLVFAIFVFFVPRHLNRFELAFVGTGSVAGKIRQLQYPFVHVGGKIFLLANSKFPHFTGQRFAQ